MVLTHRPKCVTGALIDKPRSSISNIRFLSIFMNCWYLHFTCFQSISYDYSILSLLRSVADSMYRMIQMLSLIAITEYHMAHCARKYNTLQISLQSHCQSCNLNMTVRVTSWCCDFTFYLCIL